MDLMDMNLISCFNYRRKLPSRRRIKAKLRIGQEINWQEIQRTNLAEWTYKHCTYRPWNDTVVIK